MISDWLGFSFLVLPACGIPYLCFALLVAYCHKLSLHVGAADCSQRYLPVLLTFAVTDAHAAGWGQWWSESDT